MTRNAYIQRLLDERARQFDLPGREMDVLHSPNDWIAIVCAVMSDGTTRNHMKQEAEEYERALIQAAAVILAALEHMELMKKNEYFLQSGQSDEN